jgi:hypothetical protein
MIGLRFGDFFDFFAAGLRFEEDLRAAFTVSLLTERREHISIR